jgi:hypothetical protein
MVIDKFQLTSELVCFCAPKNTLPEANGYQLLFQHYSGMSMNTKKHGLMLGMVDLWLPVICRLYSSSAVDIILCF